MQKASQEADKARAEVLYREEDAIFTDEIGRRLSPKAATNAFARLAVKAGISTTHIAHLTSEKLSTSQARHTSLTHTAYR